jgi:hypothetical protein
MAKSAYALRWLAAGALLQALATTAQADGVGCLPQDLPGFAQPQQPRAQAVVVYLHGLHGDARTTWVHKTAFSATAWPCLMLADKDMFAGADAYMAGYRSRPLAPNPDTETAARELVADLRSAKVFDYAQVGIIAHSMGGIVAARMLTLPDLLTPKERAGIRLVGFFGTPALPTEAARICDKFGINRQCQEMSDPAAMQQLWAAWDSLAQRPAARCVAEGADSWMLGVPPWMRIVPEASAHRPCGGKPQHIGRADGFDHSQLVKPGGRGIFSHRVWRNAYSNCIRPHLPPPATEPTVPAVVGPADVAAWFYGLRDRLVQDPAADLATLTASLASATGQNRFWLPSSFGAASYDPALLEPWNAPAFARAAAPLLRHTLGDSQVLWSRRIGAHSDKLSDSAFDRLALELTERGALREGDLVALLSPVEALPGQVALLLRPGAAAVAIAADPAALGLVGMLSIPRPPLLCDA